MSATKQAGVALAIVVWFIAGMSLLVAGIVAQARVDTHMTQNHLARAVVAAAGDGAIRLMLADRMAAADPTFRSRGEQADGTYRVGEVEATVILVPTSGLIDINSASLEVLLALFQAAGLAEEEARLLAQNVVQSRSVAAAAGPFERVLQLDAMEDLLRIPGFSRALLDTVRDFIVVGEASQGATNWSEAPEALLAVLDRADPARADAARTRAASTAASRGQPEALAGAYRADAIVRYGDKLWLRRRWVTTAGSSASALPWRVVRTEAPRAVQKQDY